MTAPDFSKLAWTLVQEWVADARIEVSVCSCRCHEASRPNEEVLQEKTAAALADVDAQAEARGFERGLTDATAAIGRTPIPDVAEAEARGRNQALQSEQHRTSVNVAFEEGRAAGLEEAAQLIEATDEDDLYRVDLAIAIRALSASAKEPFTRGCACAPPHDPDDEDRCSCPCHEASAKGEK